MIAGIAFIAALGITTIRYISSEIEQNTLHNRTILERSKHIEIEASRISNQVLPAYQSLHSLDISVNRHVAEFELYVLDVDRDRKLLADTLSRIEHAFDAFPDTSLIILYWTDPDWRRWWVYSLISPTRQWRSKVPICFCNY